METKDLIGLILVPLSVLCGTAVACSSQRLRDAAFFLLVSAMVINDRLDINFVSCQWYRGTTRGFEFSFVDVLAISLLASAVLRPRPGEKRFYWPAGLALMVLFLIYECFSVLISQPKLFGLFEVSKTIRAILVFLAAAFYVRSEKELRILILALGAAVCFEGALAVKEHFLNGVERATGSLDHANSLSMYLCMTGPVFVAVATARAPLYLRLLSYVCIALGALSILLTISRAGIPIYAAVMLATTLFCMSWRITLQKVGIALLIVCFVGAIVARSWSTLKDRYGEATIEDEVAGDKFENRGQYFRLASTILDERFFGVGLNNWSYHVSKTYGARIGSPYEDYDDIPESVLKSAEIYDWASKYAPPAHNLGVITVGEMGMPGLILFAFLWIRWFQMGLGFLWKRSPELIHRLGVGLLFSVSGIFLQSLTEWVYRQTAILLTFHLLLGTLASLYYIRRRDKKRRHTAELFQHSPETVITTD